MKAGNLEPSGGPETLLLVVLVTLASALALLVATLPANVGTMADHGFDGGFIVTGNLP